jgi:hypothetical protein
MAGEEGERTERTAIVGCVSTRVGNAIIVILNQAEDNVEGHSNRLIFDLTLREFLRRDGTLEQYNKKAQARDGDRSEKDGGRNSYSHATQQF